ncbi:MULTISPECIES: hypothetical protein [unclassified Methylobacterium]|uniref:hypothetical protein n=1 Tax=unclassified Methylobacterium TaxID=2615210 RepID=UPI0013531390|nr:hypothetical protein [Methylobacterium sp. 2A]MWV24763.1 hypothetical protein [Methylobacterium sp. 2A]
MSDVEIKPSSDWHNFNLRRFAGSGVQKNADNSVAVAFETEQNFNIDVTMPREAAEHLKAELEKVLR